MGKHKAVNERSAIGDSARSGEKFARADALSYLKRFPSQGLATVAANVALVLAGNALVFWLLWSGKFRAAHLIALVMAEALLLMAMSMVLQRLVPQRDWLEQPKPWRERLPVLAFSIVWIGAAYAMTLVVVNGYRDFLALLVSTDAWFAANLHWPLGATLLFALYHAATDMTHYRRHGGPFHSTVAYDAMGRFLTLLLGGIPFAMPFFAVAIGGFKGIEFIAKKAKVNPEQSVFAGLAFLGVAFGAFGVISLLVANEVTGWAIGFVFAKLIAEIMIACIPLVMTQVAREGP